MEDLLVTYLFDDKISFDDTSSIGAFNRARVATTRLLGEYRYMYGGTADAMEMNDYLAGNGTISADLDRNCYLANVTTAVGDHVVRQTKQYHPYISGTSNLAFITFVMDEAKENLVQAIGLYDDYNGIIFRMNGTVPEFVIRKNGVDSEIVGQSSWNKDRLDGTMNEYNQSGFTANFAKAQIFFTDYQWLGVGRVRVGFVMDGIIIICHQFVHANSETEVYMYQPSLPCRWEIKNSGTTASGSQLMIICGGVYCEGSDYETGFLRSVSTDGTGVSITNSNSSNGYGILAIRLKNTVANKKNTALARLKNFSISTDQDLNFKLVVLPGKSYLGNANIAWTTVPGYGWCEYIKNFSLSNTWNSSNAFNVIDDQIIAGGQANKLNSPINQAVDSRTTTIYQNYDSTDSQILAIIGYRLTFDATSYASLQWLEVK